MVFELKQNLKLTQQLIMTPQLQQSIRLLQLSTLELNAEIDQALQENPLLERDEPGEPGESIESPAFSPGSTVDAVATPQTCTSASPFNATRASLPLLRVSCRC